MLVNSPNENSFPTSVCPHLLSWLRIPNNVPSVIMAQKKARQVSCVDQYEAPSSREKRTPPMGAPKADATPAAAPQATKSGGREMIRACVRNGELAPLLAVIPEVRKL